MDTHKRKSIVNRFLSGGYHVEMGNSLYFFDFRLPAQFKSYLDHMYYKYYQKALDNGLLTKEEKIKEMESLGKWDGKKDYLIEKYKDDMKEMKKEYYKSVFNNKKKGKIKKEYKELKQNFLDLANEKHSLVSEGTCESFAFDVINRCKYSKIVKENNNCLDEDRFLNKAFITQIEYAIYENNIGEEEIREVARTNPWRLYWNNGDSSPKDIFGISMSDVSDEQQEICYWSSFYDNIYEAYERPSNEVIEDDLAIDGWYLLKSEEREKEQAKKEIVDKAGDNKEIFVVTDAENAKKVYDMNDEHVRNAMKRRDKIIKEQSAASEEDLVQKGGIGQAGLFVGQRKK